MTASQLGNAAPPAFELLAGCVEFDGNHVLDHLDLSIGAGEFVALLGANGSGKTTLVRALLGLQPLAHGKVLVHGQDLTRLKDRSRIALVPQRLPAGSGVPIAVKELVACARINPARRWRLRSKADRVAVNDALDAVGLLDRRDDRLDTLSGGQQRRAMIARALASGADTLVLDEPTAGVDAASQEGLAEILGRLHREGATIVLVAHGLGPLEPLVSRAIVLSSGHVVYDGPPPPPADYDVVHHSHEHGEHDRSGPLLEG